VTRILIVEDEGVVALEIQRQLQELGYEVVGIAASGESALDLASKRQPDLALMDIHLRGALDETETASLLLERLDVPVVYLAASTDADTLDRAKATGSSGFLVKPLDIRVLYSTVEMAMYAHGLERDLRRSEARYRAMVDDQTELVFRSGPDLVLTFVNDAFCRYFGATREALLGQRFMLAIPEEEQPKLAAYIASLNQGNPTISLTHQVLRDGEVRWLKQTGRALYGANGTLMEYQSVAHDITERIQAEIAAEQQARASRELNDITRAALAPESLPEVLQVLADRVGEIFDADACSVALWDQARNQVRPMATSTSLGDSYARIVPSPGSLTMTGAALEAGHTLAIGDLATSPFAWQREDYGFSGRAVLVLPLMTSERKLGAAVVSYDRPQDFTDETIAFGQQVSEHLSLAVARACLLDESRSHSEASEALRQLTLDLATELDLDVLLETVADRAMRLLDATAAELYLYSKTLDCLELRVALGNSAGGTGARRNQGVGLAGKVWEAGKALVVGDYLNWEGRVETSIARLPACAVGVPIHWMDEFLGVLSLGNSHAAWTYTQADADSLQLFANHAATAIVNALLHRDLAVYAETLETHVRARTAELQAIFDSAADGIIVADPQGNVLRANDIAQTLLHKTLAPEDAGELRQAIRALATHEMELPEVSLALTGLDLEMRAAPISVGDSQSSVVITVHDITLLKAADRMKTRFITSMSHELRTPVSSLRLYADLLSKCTEGKRAGYQDAILTEIGVLTHLVQQTLLVGALDAGRIAVNPQPVALNALVENRLVQFERMCDQKDLHWRAELADPSPWALVDAPRMIEVVHDLVKNATLYTLAGGDVVLRTAEQEADERRWATISVADAGIGIPEDELPQVFERFFRGRQIVEGRVAGSGLGLAIAHRIVQLHGGKITVVSEPGVGSTFTVWLPIS